MRWTFGDKFNYEHRITEASMCKEARGDTKPVNRQEHIGVKVAGQPPGQRKPIRVQIQVVPPIPDPWN